MKAAAQRFFQIFALAVCAAVFTACTQDPLFLDISREYPPIDPTIKGSPSQIVRYNNALYVANTKGIWYVNENSLSGGVSWANMGKPPGSGELIKMVAATTGTTPYLYALDYDGRIFQYNGTWRQQITAPGGAQQIYGAGSRLFIGNGSSVSYHEGSGSTAIPLSGAGGLLSGAAYAGSSYYICTSKVNDSDTTGIYLIQSNTCDLKYSGSMRGIIASGNNIYAVTYGGGVSSANGTTWTSWGGGYYFSGAMALWPDPTASSTPTPKLILLGLMHSNGTDGTGYRELDISSGNPAGPYAPGDISDGRLAADTSISPDRRETSAIAKHAVNALLAVNIPGSSRDGARPIIFASTQQNGVWSYRSRRGDPQWNGEDNSGF
jgi:hypothetical protein